MIAVSLKGIWGRKLRTLLTALAIILGVAMISGTYVLTDTITAAFTNIVDDSFTNADAVISGKVAFKNDDSNTGEGVVPAFPASVLTKVKQLPDVAAASGEVGDEAKLLGHDGKVISTGGGGSIGSSIDPANDARFTPLKLVSGQWPVGGSQIAIDKHTADTQHFGVGDTIGVAANQGTRQFEITGVAKYADSASIGAATIAIFDVPTAQRLFSKIGKYDGIQVAAKDGVTPEQLVSEIRPLLPATAKVKTSAAQTASDVADVHSSLGMMQKFLLAFGAIALFVGAFVISNTLSITIAQRVREFATLRTIGGSRRQVLRTVLLEAFVVGAFASVIGLFLGLAIAKGLNALFVGIGVEFPKGDTVLATRTIVVSLLGRDHRHPARQPPAGDQSHTGTPDRSGPRGCRTAGRSPVALRARGLTRDACSRDPGAGLRDLRRRPDDRKPSSGSRVRNADPLHRRLAERQACCPAARLAARLARHQDRRDCRHARPRERDAEPEQDRGDCVRADDRPRADHLRRHPGCGSPRLVRRRRRQAVRRRLCAHCRERLRSVRQAGRRGRGDGGRRDCGLADSRRRRTCVRRQHPGHGRHARTWRKRFTSTGSTAPPASRRSSARPGRSSTRTTQRRII